MVSIDSLDQLSDCIEFDAKLVSDDFDGRNGSSHWSVRLVCNGKSLCTKYSQGAAYRVYSRFNEGKCPTKRAVKHNWSGNISFHDHKILMSTLPTVPVLTDVLACLVMDSSSVDCSNFNDWCSDLDYDTDSRKAEKMYRECCETRANLRGMGLDLEQLSELYRDW